MLNPVQLSSSAAIIHRISFLLLLKISATETMTTVLWDPTLADLPTTTTPFTTTTTMLQTTTTPLTTTTTTPETTITTTPPTTTTTHETKATTLLPSTTTTPEITTITTLPAITTTPPTTTPPFRTTTQPTTTATTSVETTTTAATSTIRGNVFTSLSPNRGPVAGGTKVTFRGQRLNEVIGYIYFGASNSSHGKVISSTYDTLVVYSPVARDDGIVTIIQVFDENSVKRFTNLTFEYRPNPSIDRFLVAPAQLTSGGSPLTVVGTSLDSVVYPQVNVTVVLVQPVSCNRCRRATDIVQPLAVNSYNGDCTVESSENMTCLLPDLQLPENFTSKLQEDRENQNNFSTTDSGSVAVLLGPDGMEAYVYIGIIFDGYEKYSNVSDPKSGLQDPLHLNFIPPPVINSSTDVITFDPKKDDDIQIKGQRLLDGCSYGVLCEVLIGDGQCRITKVTDNVMRCVPPKERPKQSQNDSFCRPNHQKSLAIEIRIGLQSYHYRCLDYYFLDLGLVIGLTVGIGVPLLVVIAVAIFCCIRKLRARKSPPPLDGQVSRLEVINPAESSFEEPRPPSSLTTFSHNPGRIPKPDDSRTSIIGDSKSDNTSNESNAHNQNGGGPQTDDVERYTDDVAACLRNYNRSTFYPPGYLQLTDNVYTSDINDHRGAAYDNRYGSKLGDDAGEFQSSSKKSDYSQSVRNSLVNYDHNLSRNSDDSDDKEVYANFAELGQNR